VAYSAIGGGVGAGMANYLPSAATGTAGTVNPTTAAMEVATATPMAGAASSIPQHMLDAGLRSAVGNTITQGIATATGLQEEFNWRRVAASAVGGSIGAGVNQGLQKTAFANSFGQFGVRAVSGFAGGMATAAAGGGRIDAQMIAQQSFGDALGDSIVDGIDRRDQETGPLAQAEQETYSPAADPVMQARAQRFLAMNPLAALDEQTQYDFGHVSAGAVALSDDSRDAKMARILTQANNEASALDRQGNPFVVDAYGLDSAWIQEMQQVVVTANRMTPEEREASFEWDREMNRFEAMRASMPNFAVVGPSMRQDNVKNSISHTKPGSLSMKYETRMAPSDYRKAAGVVSSGKGDPGGISYGAYQLASNVGRVQDFLKKDGSLWANRFVRMNPRVVGEFGATWKDIAAQPNDDFFNAQHAYIERENFNPVVKSLRKMTGLDISALPLAVQDAVWSAAVQHGGARIFLKEAIDSVAIGRTSPEYSEMLINAIYDKRIIYVSKIDMDAKTKNNLVNIRYPDERMRALQFLKK